MRILADENIADVADLFGQFGEVVLCTGRDISPKHLVDIDVLLVRSVTRVNRQLLGANSSVRFVGSATIGTDHIDLGYVQSRQIEFAHAPGCNANAVAQYIIAVLCHSRPAWRGQTIGIVGCGNVGGQLLDYLQGLNVDCRVYDPFLNASQCALLTDFERVMAADIVCLHTPLSTTGPFPTLRMIDATALKQMKPDAILINAGRGEVIDNDELLAALNADQALQVVFDVWENEPVINLELLDKVRLGTPHVAGHSIEGKLRGTEMLLEAFCRWQNYAEPTLGRDTDTDTDTTRLAVSSHDSLEQIILKIYDPGRDYAEMFRQLSISTDDSVGGRINKETDDKAEKFDVLRRDYPQRREFSHYEITGITDKLLSQDLKTLGFKVA